MDKAIALGVIAFGAYYLWTSGALGSLLGDLGLGDGSTVALTPEQQRQQQVLQAAGMTAANVITEDQATEPRRGAGGAYVFASAGAGTAAGIAGAAGLGATGAMGALALTGYGAAAALLVWGITQKGWFRGGEEGVRVNPARDQFQDVFVKVYFGEPTSFSREEINEKRYWGMVYALRDGANGGTLGDTASQIIGQLYAADTMDEFEIAAQRFLRAMKEGA